MTQSATPHATRPVPWSGIVYASLVNNPSVVSVHLVTSLAFQVPGAPGPGSFKNICHITCSLWGLFKLVVPDLREAWRFLPPAQVRSMWLRGPLAGLHLADSERVAQAPWWEEAPST